MMPAAIWVIPLAVFVFLVFMTFAEGDGLLDGMALGLMVAVPSFLIGWVVWLAGGPS